MHETFRCFERAWIAFLGLALAALLATATLAGLGAKATLDAARAHDAAVAGATRANPAGRGAPHRTVDATVAADVAASGVTAA